MLREIFIELCSKYSSNHELIAGLWNELEQNYSHKKRHYHTLEHLQNMLNQLLEVKDKMDDWDCTLFSLFYHDAVYNSLKNDNEEKSALLAEKRMKELNIDTSTIKSTSNFILATKKHVLNANNDINYFIDADLSILGFPWVGYKEYADGVRKEYSIYPDIIYKPGRRKVLQHFLAMDNIFKTSYFKEKFEEQAKQNIQKELQLL